MLGFTLGTLVQGLNFATRIFSDIVAGRFRHALKQINVLGCHDVALLHKCAIRQVEDNIFLGWLIHRFAQPCERGAQ